MEFLKDFQEITIVIHRDPDFDCCCAAWLVAQHLERGSFSDGSEQVAHYASAVDSGKIHIRKEFYLVPASVMNAFYKTIPELLAPGNHDKRNEWIRKRAFELMDWCAGVFAQGVSGDDDEKLHTLKSDATIFAQECDALRKDRPLYEEDLADPSVTKKYDSFSVINREYGLPEEVKALVFSRPPRSSLTKYYARDEGYLVTIIPMECGNLWDDVFWKPGNFSGKPNRVIISVPPDSKYTLKPLAIQLERAECEMERKILGEAAELKRTRTSIRNGYEDEGWVINNDPWFDGSSHNHTIVDSPSSLSLLPTHRIISIALNHTKKDVIHGQLHIISPMILKKRKNSKGDPWVQFISRLGGKSPDIRNDWIQYSNNTEIFPDYDYSEKYFLESVEKALSYTNGGIRNTTWFEKQTGIFLKKGPYGEITAENLASPDDQTDTAGYTVSSIRMVGFSSHIGFIIATVTIQNLMTGDIPDLLNSINSSHSHICSWYSLPGDEICWKDPAYMVYVEFDGEKLHYLDIGQDVFSICSFLEETTPQTDGTSERKRMEKMLLRINASMVFGFSRNCTVLASSSRKKQSRLITAYEEKFIKGHWIYEMVLILHQYYFLAEIKNKLGLIDAETGIGLTNLESEYVTFTANSCFSQVTSDPVGAELYSRWKNLMILDDLNREICCQIGALNNHVTSSIERTLSFITFVFFPMTLLLSILDYFQFFNMSNSGQSEKVIILTGIFVICFSFWIFFLSGYFRIYALIGNYILRKNG